MPIMKNICMFTKARTLKLQASNQHLKADALNCFSYGISRSPEAIASLEPTSPQENSLEVKQLGLQSNIPAIGSGSHLRELIKITCV